MKPVCPFVRASRPDDTSIKKPGENQNKQPASQESKPKQESGESAIVSPKCPFGYGQETKPKEASGESAVASPQCPFGYGQENKAKQESGESATVSPKCPFGYDSQAFKLGPFSCMICQALLYDCSRCVPCSHVFCK